MNRAVSIIIGVALSLRLAGFVNAQEKQIDSLSGFDVQQAMNDFLKKGYSASDLAGYLKYQKKKFLEAKFGAPQPLKGTTELPSPDQMTPCTNMDFESGNFSGWTGTTGTFAACCPNVGIVPGRHTIVSGPGLDPCGGFPMVAPGGSFSVKLGNNQTGAEAEQMMQTFTVTQPFFIYQYACVLEDPQHAATDQPYFKVEVLNSLGQPLTCGNYSFVAGQGVPGFFNSTTCAGVIYKPWTTIAVDLSLYMGLNVTVKFTTADCAQSGHYGYGYIDGACLQAQITQSNTFCTGGTAQLCAPPGMNTYAWSPGGQNTQCITINTAGSYTVNMTTSSPCPLLPLTKTVTQYPSPSAAVNTTLTSCSACTGAAAANITGGTAPYTYSWSPTGGNGPVATGLCSGNYTLTVTTADGCQDTALFTIGNSANLFANAAGQTQPSCFGGTNGTATVTASGGTGTYSYVWNTNPVQSTAVATGLAMGTYTVTVYDSNGCTAQNIFNITQPPVTGVFGSSVNASCFGSCNGGANVVMSGGTAPYTYVWSPSGGNSSAATGLCAGNYSVLVTDMNGCTATNSYTVGQPATAVSGVAAGTNPKCSNGTGSATAAGAGGSGGPYHYSWSSGQTTAGVTGLAAGTYTVTIKDSKGCPYTTTVTITPPPAINVGVNSTNATCGQQDGSATATASGGSPAFSYVWSNGQSSANATGLGVGSYTVTVTDSKGCTQTQTALINTLNGPVTTMSQTNILCNGQCTGAANASVTGGNQPYTYAWSGGQTTTAVSGLCAGNYSVVVADATGCTNVQTFSITQPTSPLTVMTTSSNASCGQNDGAAMANAMGGTGTFSYLWNTGQTSVGISGLAVGAYTVTTTDSNGCSQISVVQINNSSGPTIISFSSNNPTCNGNTNGNASVTATGSNLTYSWTPNVSNGSSANNLGPGTYTVVVSDGSACSAIQIFNLTQPQPITASATSNPDQCSNGSGDATATASGGTGNLTYIWMPGGQAGASISGLNAGNYVVTVTDANGCTQVASTTVIGIPGPTAAAGADVTLLVGADTLLYASGGGTYSWNPSAGLSCTNCPNPKASPDQTTQYCVTVTDTNGCTDSDCITVYVEYPCPENIILDLPTAFTPNGDGHNDVFRIEGIEHCVKKYSLNIYNRWGEPVYQSTDFTQSWDGTFRGKPLDPAVFVYYFTALFDKGGSVQKKGNISLLR